MLIISLILSSPLCRSISWDLGKWVSSVSTPTFCFLSGLLIVHSVECRTGFRFHLIKPFYTKTSKQNKKKKLWRKLGSKRGSSMWKMLFLEQNFVIQWIRKGYSETFVLISFHGEENMVTLVIDSFQICHYIK